MHYRPELVLELPGERTPHEPLRKAMPEWGAQPRA